MGHVGRPADVALPAALHVIVWPASVASAVPATARLFPHVAENDPLALVEVWSVTVHLKSVHGEEDGATLADDHVPMSALMPVDEGPVIELVCSNPIQPAARVAAKKAKLQPIKVFFMRPSERLRREPRVVGRPSIP